MAGALTNTQWGKICAAAGRRPAAEAEARATLEKLLFDLYPIFVYDAERMAEKRAQAERMLEHLDAFATLYWRTFLPGLPADQFEAILTGYACLFTPNEVVYQRDWWAIAGMRPRVLGNLLDRLHQQEANARNKSEKHATLYHWLCQWWLDYFEGPELPPVGPLRTPLVKFILASMRLVMSKSELPKPDTVRDNIDYHRQERAKLTAKLLQRRDAGFAPPK